MKALVPNLRRGALLLALLLTWATQGAAQNVVTGTVLDSLKQEAVPFANVVLKAAGGQVAQAALTDENGHFTLQTKPGSYQLQVLQLGFATYTKAVTLAAGTAPLDLGPLPLTAAAQKLEEVVVIAQKPLLEQKPDRVTMNVAGSLLAAGNSAAEVLAAAPSVQLINGRVSFRGKGNVLILLDGKRLPAGTNLETLLASIPGDQIDHIELISNPSAKYDADASGGVIEIYTKRAKGLGWTANLGANARQGQRTGAGLNAGLRVSTAALDLSASGSFNRRGGFERSTSARTLYQGRTPVAGLAQRSDLDKVSEDGSFSGSLHYHPSARATVGVDVDVLRSGIDATGAAQTVLSEKQGVTTSNIAQDVQLHDAFSNYALFYRHTLDSLGSTLGVAANYAAYTNRQQQAFAQQVQGPLDTVLASTSFRNVIPASYRIYTAGADYGKHWSPATRLETGLKYTDTRNESRQELTRLGAGGEWQPQPLTPFSQLGYQEQVAAAYASLNHTTGALSLQAGLRAERTHYQVTGGVDSSYFNLFPNLRADYKFSADYTSSLAYAKNLRRPAYESLIPYERFVDPYTTRRGNARLRPEYAHTFSWNHLYKGFGLQLAYTQTVGAISAVYVYEAANLRFVSTQLNLPQRHLASATLTAPWAPASWWSINNSAVVQYQELRFPSPLAEAGLLAKHKVTVTLSTDHTLTWGSGWSARVYGLYNSPSFNGLFDFDAYSYVSVGLRRSFLQKRASLNLTVVDLFYQTNFRVSSTLIPVVSEELTRNDTRQVRLSFTYNLGKADLKSKSTGPRGNADEVNRLGK
ncbi:MAG TPA: outer membrane beta-barrel protein [Hymenobacter sp.]|jgi:outer membrane receptor protein involved in Fe transport|uniref:outer membrane beta-barrel protein n=1 Tax=Hymenobacter sp. TaxID=1898978 RepID=UPI002ED9ADA6